jgi:hypothetical protein
MTETLDGRCGCGAVSYRMTGRPMFVNCCHCLDCQRQTGSAFVINALIEADRVQVSGETAATRMPTDSGQPHDIHRCAACGTALWSEYGGRSEIRFMRVGTLNDPTAIAPDAHIFTRTKQPWVSLPADRAYEVFYPTKTTWPGESIERRKAALGV